MHIRKISDAIYYAGVNDRVSARFEGLWPLPYGVSYNSYIVKGSEKTALIDTVESGYFREFINSITETGTDRIDYLVINHMEPDHSGGIPGIVAAFPGIKLVGNKKAIEMVRGFYHLEDDSLFLEVEDGREIDLGGLTLRFLMTPMVHWPETMMTYCPEKRAIFSGDAFGTFGALNGGLIDEEMECSLYLSEMYRYYSNIVGKYGQFVLKAISKIEGIGLDYICSTHGPVWHKLIPDVKDIVARLAAYSPEAGVTIVYGSMYGNTAEAVELFARELSAFGIRNIRIHNASVSDLSFMISDAFRYQGLVIASPTYNTELFPPVAALVNALKGRGIKNKVVAAIGSYSWAPAAAGKLTSAFESMGLTVAGCVAMKQSLTPDVETQLQSLAENFANMLNDCSL